MTMKDQIPISGMDVPFVPQDEGDWFLLDQTAMQIFKPATPIDDKRLFVGRLDQIDQLIEAVHQDGMHAILYGERGVGKTSLANTIDQDLFSPVKSYSSIKINCDFKDTFISIWSKVFDDFVIDEQEKQIPASSLLEQNPQPFTVYKLLRSLKRSDVHQVIILDEFDRVVDEETKTLIADTLKYLSDNPLNATVLIVGVGQSVESLLGSHPSISRCCIQIPMPRMNAEELKDILDKRLPQLHMTISEDAELRMLRSAHGLPGFMHLLGQLASRSAIKRRTLNIDVSHWFDSIQKAVDKSEESIRRAFQKATASSYPGNKYKEVLLACAIVPKDDLGRFSAGDLRATYSQIAGGKKEITDYARHLSTFCQKDRGPALIKTGKPKSYKYHFENPLLEPYVVLKGLSDGVINYDDLPPLRSST